MNRYRSSAAVWIGAALVSGLLNVPGLLVSSFDPVLYGIIALYLLWGIVEFVRPAPSDPERRGTVCETLLALAILYFGFLYAYAANANVDYVQRFIRGGGELWLAENTARERWIALIRILPLSAAGVMGVLRAGGRDNRWAIFAVLGSVVLVVAAHPSFVSVQGLRWLGWLAWVPLLVVIRQVRYHRAVVYGVIWGAFASLGSLYWLATYSLISLQVAIVIMTVKYLLFFLGAVWIARRAGRLEFLSWALLWVGFEWMRSLGFLGFPWALAAHTQYRSLGVMQVASLTGVWGVSFVVLFANAGLAETWIRLRRFEARWARPTLASGALVLAAAAVGHLLVLRGEARLAELPTMRFALVQQNTDPRRHDYEATFATLRRLTDETLVSAPDLVVWSETAFVPNIRRWSGEDPDRYEYARLVRRFLAYQRSVGTWLVTGNDDYEREIDDRGNEIRYSYNAAVMFDEHGIRRGTYRKIRLVPFTEHFPYRQSLPGVLRLLERFDVTLWEPGTERVVFEHPGTGFATPICFEDVFPSEVRQFVRAGATTIVNLSNDYWSLTPVEAAQHYGAAVFRSVENRTAVLRSAASGVTCHVTPYGRLAASVPLYEEAALVVDVPVGDPRAGTTLYTRLGDWFPVLALTMSLLAFPAMVRLAQRRS